MIDETLYNVRTVIYDPSTKKILSDVTVDYYVTETKQSDGTQVTSVESYIGDVYQEQVVYYVSKDGLNETTEFIDVSGQQTYCYSVVGVEEADGGLKVTNQTCPSYKTPNQLLGSWTVHSTESTTGDITTTTTTTSYSKDNQVIEVVEKNNTSGDIKVTVKDAKNVIQYVLTSTEDDTGKVTNVTTYYVNGQPTKHTLTITQETKDNIVITTTSETQNDKTVTKSVVKENVSQPEEGMSPAVIVGIVIAVIAVGALIFFGVKHHQKKKRGDGYSKQK